MKTIRKPPGRALFGSNGFMPSVEGELRYKTGFSCWQGQMETDGSCRWCEWNPIAYELLWDRMIRAGLVPIGNLFAYQCENTLGKVLTIPFPLIEPWDECLLGAVRAAGLMN
jgi:hypothetical protein